jgi:Glycosyl hydrolase catalytic core/Ricin-type beta-trefoil lectin domain-like/Putative Ig domain
MKPALAACCLVSVATPRLRAATIEAGNVTTALGPGFFVDDAANGGSDTDIHQPTVAAFNRFFNGLLTRNQGPTRVILTGFGFAAHSNATANDATSVAVTFTYLGVDELLNGGDDVNLGTVTGTYSFTVGGEYVFAFDTPLAADLIITGTRFRIQIAPTNTGGGGSLKLKTSTLAYETTAGPRLSVAGVVAPLINPQRVNLAKFQPVATGSVTGQRLASYVTDGVAGNENRWQGESWAYNYARVDFPFPVEVGSAQVFMGVDDTFPISNFNIQYLNGSTWVTIPGGSVSGNTNVERNLVFTNPVTASTFRLSGQDGNLRIRELALYPPNGPGGFPIGTDLTVNLGYQRPTVASANTAGNFALKAVDGRAHVGSTWQTDTAGVNTLDIDLRVSTKIGSAHLYSGSTGVSPLADFILKYWDGATWQNLSGGTVTGNTTPDLVVPINTPVTTTKVRLEFTNPGTTSIRELCIFPANTGNVGYPLGTNIIGSGPIAKFEDYNDAFYLINNPASSRTMAVPNNGQPSLSQAGLTTGQGQYQVLLNLSNGTYRLRNRASGNCLSGAQLSKTPGLPLTDAPYAALPHQDWILDPLGGGGFRLVNQWSGLVIDTEGAATSAGTTLVQNTANNVATQLWEFSYFAGHPKKGIGGTTFATSFNPGWAYNWGQKNSNPLTAGAVYHPMQWGDFGWTIGSNSGPLWQYYPTWRDSAEGIHLLGFNEPDRTDQSNITMSNVLSLWPRVQEMDLPLASPSPGTIGGDGGWLDTFYTQADALGYRVDYTAVHTYPGPSGGSSNNLINFVQSAYTYNSKNRPVWLTEFSFVDWGRNQSWSEEDNYQCLAEFLWRAEGEAKLRKYALFVFTENAEYPQPANPWQSFTPAPRSNSFDTAGNLTAFGKLYAAWDSDTTVRTGKSYLIHHKDSHKRLANLLDPGPGGQTIRVDGQSVNWTLAPTGTSGRYYVVSSRDGRRLSSISGAAPTLAPSGTTGSNVEWTLTESQYGWFYVGHPATNLRLQLSFNNTTSVATYSMAAATTTTNAVQWRFIVPAIQDTAPVLAAIPPLSGNEGVPLTFTASATDPDLPANALTYSLVGAPGGASINPGTGVFTWTPAETQGPGSFNFTVRVSDGNLTDDLPVSIAVNETNTAPVLAAIPPQTVRQSNLLTFTASAADADLPANSLTYSLVGAPSGALIDANTGAFTWTPTETQGPGSFNFTVRVGDGTLTHQQPVAVTVESPLPSAQADTDGDGLSDLLEYAFVTSPGTPNGNPFRVICAAAGNVTLEFPWNWQAAGLIWQIRHGHDLSNIAGWNVVPPGITTTTREGDTDRITATPAMAYPDRGFYILEVIGN